ncbi:hypothetical protein RclHR1_01210004 [Rhizophagus clarus]|uniref:F-box domain-containing protein n=1 Tax=Rhizophagus clarus TaxID=94130 RepID=A0A2Z6QZ40_9GLOM|nr:hypothetical protein RclHR1_01210004 [Rhizophagus clarus]GES97634.1 hypothetical protein GLOIN_2v1869474 [Rhizophagus clarus]
MACSKLFSGDLPEITEYILQYLRNDLRSLYSCILINRLFCRISIPLLWEDPFSIPLSDKTFLHFLDIYFSYLNDVTKNFGFNMIETVSLETCLFNYPSFLKSVNSSLMDAHLKVWRKTTRNLMNTNKLIEMLLKIFIENNASLYKLQIEDQISSIKEIYNVILKNPKFISGIKDFRIISTGFQDTPKFLSYLSLNCESIKYLEFDISKESVHTEYLREIKNLFLSQATLSKVFFNRTHSLTESLKYCSNTLTSIKFHFIIFDEEMLFLNEAQHLIHIKSLEFKYCEKPELFIQPFSDNSISLKIKTLILYDNVIRSIFPFQLLFHNIGPYLKYLAIIYQQYYFIEDFYEFIFQYCKNIEFLHFTDINYDNSPELIFQILELFNDKLRYLTLESKGKVGKNVLKELGQLLPINLEYLDIKFDVDPINLKLFFESCNHVNNLKKLLISNNSKNNLNITLNIIKEFVKGKNLEYLSYTTNTCFSSLSDYLNDEIGNIVKVKMYDDLVLRPSDIDGLF